MITAFKIPVTIMIRSFLFVCSFIGLVACTYADNKSNPNFYRLHPRQLQVALKSCPGSTHSKLTCEELRSIGEHTAQLAYELQQNPQQFGAKIMSLQMELANPTDAKQHTTVQQELNERLAIVEWLESPEGF